VNGLKKQLSQALQDKLEALPDCPGVYLFKDSKERIIYVGKAKNLRHRVRSYFTGGDDGRYQYPRLIAAIRDVEVLLTRDEVEALRTEATIIRLHSPCYNVDLKDDKTYPYLKITREPFPRVFLTRKPRAKDGDYYGPYTDITSTRGLLRTLKRILQIRDCNLALTPKKIAESKFKLCLDFHIGRCGGSCVGKVSLEEYKKGIDRFLQFLQGRHDEILEDLKQEMHQLATELRFEEAAGVRDRLAAAQMFTERQKKVNTVHVNQDAIGMVREDSFVAFSVLKIRGGRIVGQSPFYMERAGGLNNHELLEAFVTRHYNLVDTIPGEVFLPHDPPDMLSLSGYLSDLAGRKVRLHIPQRGEKHGLLNLARVNAEHLLAEKRLMAEKRDFTPRSIKALQEQLSLPTLPMLIEAFDISNLFGQDSVASMVVFKDGKPFKSGYRIFKIKTVDGIDDVASIGEAVKRRYSRVITEMLKYEKYLSRCQVFIPDRIGNGIETTVRYGDLTSGRSVLQENTPCLPDLILIDGGKGQLSRAKSVLDELGLSNLPVIGLTKRLEEIVLPGISDPLSLPKTSSALRLLQQVRDEAHRFAIAKHRLLRGKRQVRSRLDDIPGIGPARRTALLKKFGSINRIAAADVDDIKAVKGMTRKVAEVVKKELCSE